MNWLDIIIVIIVLIPAFTGFRKGFMRKVLGIAGIAAGFILAVKFYSDVSAILSPVIKESPTLVNVISFLLIVALIYAGAVWLARFMSDISPGTEMLNKLLGVTLGLVQGVIISSVLLYNLSFINIPSMETRNSSMLYKHVYKAAPAMFDKIIELFPGLEETYMNYKNKPAENKK
jgi:membrane protein required for colicin V production